jgi:hypothetical protein
LFLPWQCWIEFPLVHRMSFVIMLLKELKYSTYSSPFLSIKNFTCNDCLLLLIIHFLPYLLNFLLTWLVSYLLNYLLTWLVSYLLNTYLLS